MTEENNTKQKVGIMGGTFNPIHYGHLLIAENAVTQFGLDKVWFMPTGHSPHKDDRKILDNEERCTMIQMAIQGNPFFELSRFEIESEEVNYSYRTILALQEKHPDTKFFFLMGGDSLYHFDSWKNPGIILEHVTVLAAVRDDMDSAGIQKRIGELTDKYHGEIYAINTPNFSVSSQNIRTRVEQGRSIRYMLPEDVREYIYSNHIYQ